MLRRQAFTFVGALALLVAGLVEPVSAAPAQRTWVGPLTGGLWSTAANWSPAGPLENGDQLVFNHPTTHTVDDVPGLSVARMDISSGPSFRRMDITAAGGATLTLTGPVVVDSGIDFHLVVPIAVAGDVDVQVETTGEVFFERPLTGISPLRKTGLGPLHLDDNNGTSTLSGGISAELGSVIPHSDTALGSGPIVFTQGVLELEGGRVVPNPIVTVPAWETHQYLESNGDNELTGQLDAPNGQMVVASGSLTLSGPVESLGGSPSSVNKIGLGNLIIAMEGSQGTVRVLGGPASIVTPDGVRAVDGIVVGEPTDVGTFVSGVVTHFGDNQVGGVTTFPGSTYDLLGTNQSTDQMISFRGDLLLGFVDGGVVDASLLQAPHFTAESTGTVVFAVGPGAPGVGHDQIRAEVAVVQSHLGLDVADPVPFGVPIRLVDITGSAPWNGNTFVGLDQGALFNTGGSVWQISYTGGTGNDITVTRVASPSDSSWQFDPLRPWIGHTRHAPAASAQAGTRIDSWVTGLDNGLWHQWSNLAGTISGGEALGGILTSSPAAVSWASNHLAVFARGADGALWQRTYSQRWGPWTSLGGQMVGGPAVTSWSHEHLEVFAQGIDGALWHRSFINGAWSGWESLGGIMIGSPAAASWADGRTDVFARGADNQLWHRHYDEGWSPWAPLGGILTGSPAVTAPAPDQLVLVARGADGGAWLRSWEAGGWSSWNPLPWQLPDAVGIAARGSHAVTMLLHAADGTVFYADGFR